MRNWRWIPSVILAAVFATGVHARMSIPEWNGAESEFVSRTQQRNLLFGESMPEMVFLHLPYLLEAYVNTMPETEVDYMMRRLGYEQIKTYHSVGTPYVDAGAVAFDVVDGAVLVTSSGTVDWNTVGDYEITYTAEDEHGNERKRKRTICVR